MNTFNEISDANSFRLYLKEHAVELTTMTAAEWSTMYEAKLAKSFVAYLRELAGDPNWEPPFVTTDFTAMTAAEWIGMCESFARGKEIYGLPITPED